MVLPPALGRHKQEVRNPLGVSQAKPDKNKTKKTAGNKTEKTNKTNRNDKKSDKSDDDETDKNGKTGKNCKTDNKPKFKTMVLVSRE